MHKDTRRIVKAAISRGWTLLKTAKHWMMIHPKGDRVTFAATPSCPHAVKNFEQDLARVEKRIQREELALK